MKLDRTKVLLLMAKYSMTQSMLASAAEISKQTLSTVMNGRNCGPKLLGNISKALNVDPEQIIED